jgi:heat shock protein HtpX
VTLYTQVANNRVKTWGFLLLYAALLLAIGYFLSWWFGTSSLLLIFGVIAIVQGWLGYYYSDKIALATARAKPLDDPRVNKIVENLCITAGLPMPKIYLIPDTALNAFATGRDPKHASIAVTAGLLQRLDDNQLAGVLAHELSHVGNEDIRLMSLVMVLAGLISLVSHFMLRGLWFGGGRRRDNNSGGDLGPIMLVAYVAVAILAPIAATLIQLAISRKREFMADANGVLLTRYPEGLISALRIIGSDPEPVAEASNATAHMYFSNPLSRGALASLFSTHPPIAARIAALEAGSGLKS